MPFELFLVQLFETEFGYIDCYLVYNYFWQDSLFKMKTIKRRTNGNWEGQSSGQWPDMRALTEQARDYFPAAAPVTSHSVVLLHSQLLPKWKRRLDKNRESRSQVHCQGQTQDRGAVTTPPTISSPPAGHRTNLTSIFGNGEGIFFFQVVLWVLKDRTLLRTFSCCSKRLELLKHKSDHHQCGPTGGPWKDQTWSSGSEQVRSRPLRHPWPATSSELSKQVAATPKGSQEE